MTIWCRTVGTTDTCSWSSVGFWRPHLSHRCIIAEHPVISLSTFSQCISNTVCHTPLIPQQNLINHTKPVTINNSSKAIHGSKSKTKPNQTKAFHLTYLFYLPWILPFPAFASGWPETGNSLHTMAALWFWAKPGQATEGHLDVCKCLLTLCLVLCFICCISNIDSGSWIVSQWSVINKSITIFNSDAIQTMWTEQFFPAASECSANKHFSLYCHSYSFLVSCHKITLMGPW